MSYNKFTLEKVVELFQLDTQPWTNALVGISEVEPSAALREYLDENYDWALAQMTEKARSELLIMPILAHIRKHLHKQISIFSGKSFDVDAKLGLKGICDFIISKSPDIFVLRAPIVCIVEAKKGAIENGWGQCASEMIAARIFNEKHHTDIPVVFGIVTSGDYWQFMKLHGNTLYIQPEPVHFDKLSKIIGFLLHLLAPTTK